MRLIPVILAACLLASSPARAQGDHERARKAVAAGEAMPLEAMLKRLRHVTAGQVIEVEFEREGGRWTYEFKVLESSGVIREIEMDARTGRVIEIEVERR